MCSRHPHRLQYFCSRSSLSTCSGLSFLCRWQTASGRPSFLLSNVPHRIPLPEVDAAHQLLKFSPHSPERRPRLAACYVRVLARTARTHFPCFRTAEVLQQTQKYVATWLETQSTAPSVETATVRARHPSRLTLRGRSYEEAIIVSTRISATRTGCLHLLRTYNPRVRASRAQRETTQVRGTYHSALLALRCRNVWYSVHLVPLYSLFYGVINVDMYSYLRVCRYKIYMLAALVCRPGIYTYISLYW